jgi:hypothetical protein
MNCERGFDRLRGCSKIKAENMDGVIEVTVPLPAAQTEPITITSTAG